MMMDDNEDDIMIERGKNPMKEVKE